MKTTIIIFSSILVFCALSPAQTDNFFYLVTSQSLNGYTGNIINPSPYTVPQKKYSFGLHRFNIGVNYGINNSWETGIFFNLKEYEHFTSTSFAVHTKYHFIKQHALGKPFDLSAGIYNDSLYFVFARQFSQFMNAVLESGVDISSIDSKKSGYFISVTKPTKYSYFILDYRSNVNQANFGWRVLLSPDVKLDLFLINLDKVKNAFDNFVFGLTLIG